MTRRELGVHVRIPARRCIAFLVALLACREPTAPTAAVRFYLDAPFCVGSHIPLQFSIDDAVVGDATLMNRDTTGVFTTSAGAHLLRARMVGAAFDQDTTVNLGAGELFIMHLEFYCS